MVVPEQNFQKIWFLNVICQVYQKLLYFVLTILQKWYLFSKNWGRQRLLKVEVNERLSFSNFRSAWKKSKILFGKIEILGNCLKIHNKVWDIDLDELNRKTACWLSWTKIFEKFGFKMESVNHPKSCYSSFWWFCKNGRYFRINEAENNLWRWKSTKESFLVIFEGVWKKSKITIWKIGFLAKLSKNFQTILGCISRRTKL